MWLDQTNDLITSDISLVEYWLTKIWIVLPISGIKICNYFDFTSLNSGTFVLGVKPYWVIWIPDKHVYGIQIKMVCKSKLGKLSLVYLSFRFGNIFKISGCFLFFGVDKFLIQNAKFWPWIEIGFDCMKNWFVTFVGYINQTYICSHMYT